MPFSLSAADVQFRIENPLNHKTSNKLHAALGYLAEPELALCFNKLWFPDIQAVEVEENLHRLPPEHLNSSVMQAYKGARRFDRLLFAGDGEFVGFLELKLALGGKFGITDWEFEALNYVAPIGLHYIVGTGRAVSMDRLEFDWRAAYSLVEFVKQHPEKISKVGGVNYFNVDDLGGHTFQ